MIERLLVRLGLLTSSLLMLWGFYSFLLKPLGHNLSKLVVQPAGHRIGQLVVSPLLEQLNAVGLSTDFLRGFLFGILTAVVAMVVIGANRPKRVTLLFPMR